MIALALVLFLADLSVGRDSTRLTVAPRGLTFGPVQGSVRVVIDRPTADWYCPSVEIEYPGRLGDALVAKHEEDCKPWEEWVSEFDVPAIRGGKFIIERPERRWDYTWRAKLYSGPNPITVRLRQGKNTRVMYVSIPVL